MKSVNVQIQDLTSDLLTVEFAVRSTGPLVLPHPMPAKRTDDLWMSTCFEVFMKPGDGEAYYEYNFSPSTAWAAYAFDRYREGMRELPMRFDPDTWLSSLGEHFFLWTEFGVLRPSSGNDRMGLSAIIEEKDGTKSYWALKHPPGAPDFHHPDCFALQLPAPQRT